MYANIIIIQLFTFRFLFIILFLDRFRFMYILDSIETKIALV